MKILKTYKSIIKEASLFSGVQIILLLITMIKGKIVAKYLGVEATGIMGGVQTIISFFLAFFSLGLPVLLVRSYALNDKIVAVKQQLILKRLIVFLAIIGVVLFYVLTPLFSNVLFNYVNYAWVFKMVAIVIFFKQLSVINTATLQGKQLLSSLAKVNVFSAIIGLLVFIPFYYFFKFEGVIMSYVITFVLEALFSKIANKKDDNVTYVNLQVEEYLTTLKQAFFIGYGNVLTLFSQLVVYYFIIHYYGLIEVGFYNVGFSIINNYVALLFVAMSTGYLPRIIKLLSNKNDLEEEIAKQLNFSLVVIGGLAAFCILFAPFIIKILFSEEFLNVVPFLQIAVFGMLFKSFSWCLGYLIIAKADTKVLAFTGVFYNLLYALMLIFGYEILGLKGVGYAFVLYNFLHLSGVWLIARYKYSLIISNITVLLLFGMLLLNILLLLL